MTKPYLPRGGRSPPPAEPPAAETGPHLPRRCAVEKRLLKIQRRDAVRGFTRPGGCGS